MMYYGILGYSMIFYGILGYSMMYYGILWYSRVFYDILWYSRVFYDVLWYSLVYRHGHPPKDRTTTPYIHIRTRVRSAHTWISIISI